MKRIIPQLDKIDPQFYEKRKNRMKKKIINKYL